MSFPEQLKKARKRAGYTQKEVANHIGITNSAYCAYEIGNRQPDVEKIRMIADFLCVSIDTLFEREEKAWQDNEVMAAINDGFNSLFNSIGKALNDADAFERKMAFDALVELRHYLTLIKERKCQADASLSLLQCFLGTSGRFVDICASITDETAEKPRIERAKQIAMSEYSDALDESLEILFGKSTVNG